MEKIKKISIILLIVLGLVLSNLNCLVVKAATVSGATGSLTITKNVTGVSYNVTNTYTYTVTPTGDNTDYVSNGTFTFDIVFDNAEPVNNAVTETYTLSIPSTVTFSKVGTYVFTVTETGSSDTTNYPIDDDTIYYIFVDVTNEVDADNIPTGNLIATLRTYAAIVSDPDEESDKTTTPVFPASSVYTNITLTKTVKGDLADTEEYFKFKLVINGTEYDTYTISGQSYTGATTEYIVKDGDDNYVYIYLKAGETVTIGVNSDTNEIPVGISYTITEVDATDYDTTIDTDTEAKTITKTTGFSGNDTTFVNEKSLPSVTGLFLNIAPFVVILVVAILGIIIIVKRRKKVDEI